MPEPDWVASTVWWQVYPLGFSGADTTGTDLSAGDGLDHLVGWLDYAVELGVNGLILGPIFAASTHGYDTVDYFGVDPRLGGEAAFDRLLGAARQRGLRILLDGVFNHVGREFGPFRELGASAEAAETWFRPRAVGPGEPRRFETFEGHEELIALNHASPTVRAFVGDVMTHWLERGVDGWRLDAAYAVAPEFWAEVLDRVRTEHPGAYLLGEVIHGDYRAIVARSGLDSLTQYELWKAIWSSLNDVNFYELAAALERHNGYLAEFAPLTFVGNHDVTRLAARLGDARHLPHALVLLLTLGGTPTIYYGDEQAFQGVKEERRGGDDAVRPAFPRDPAALAPHGWPVYRLHQQLIGVRRNHPWLHRATTEVVSLDNGQIVYAVSAGETQRLCVALNLADVAATVELATAPGAASMILGDGSSTQQGDSLRLAPSGWAICVQS